MTTLDDISVGDTLTFDHDDLRGMAFTVEDVDSEDIGIAVAYGVGLSHDGDAWLMTGTTASDETTVRMGNADGGITVAWESVIIE